MSSCEKFEPMLWDYESGALSGKDKVFLENHLNSCPQCREALDTIRLINRDKTDVFKQISESDGSDFEKAVFEKIRIRNLTKLKSKSDNISLTQITFSIITAAAIVVFMMMSLSNFETFNSLPVKSTLGYSIGGDSAEYDFYHIQLNDKDGLLRIDNPKESPLSTGYTNTKQEKNGDSRLNRTKEQVNLGDFTDKSEPASKKNIKLQENFSSPGALGIVSREKSASKPDLELTEIPIGSDIDKDRSSNIDGFAYQDKLDYSQFPQIEKSENRALSEESLTRAKQSEFSLIQEPVASPSPDSVNISHIYLSEDFVPQYTQQSRANLSEVIVDTGIIANSNINNKVIIKIEKMPVPLKIETPEFPSYALTRKVSGTVWIRVRIDETGAVTHTEFISSDKLGYGFEEAAIKAARQNKYSPAETDGVKIPVWILYPVEFIYKDDY